MNLPAAIALVPAAHFCTLRRMEPEQALLELHHCFEKVDAVPHDAKTTEFKRRARLHQALWREKRDLPRGTEPYRPTKKRPRRPSGSRLEIESAWTSGSNFLSDAALKAVEYRLGHAEPKQMLDKDRLYADLLSSMPMCFNLFGPLWEDNEACKRAVSAWWPDAPSAAKEVRFEWSPGRGEADKFIENRSAFDAAIILENGGIIGIETKYHEHLKAEKMPNAERLARYRLISEQSGVFLPGALEKLEGTPLQQIWQDHLLTLSTVLQSDFECSWAKFILIYPQANLSFAKGAAEYKELLKDSSTFEARTIESLLEEMPLNAAAIETFRERYLF